ncbi:MAG: glycosyltransferase family 4 protein [archaeon]
MGNKNLKVLLITQNFPPETVGGATHNYEMAKYLQKKGCDVEVLTTYPTYPYGEFNPKNKFYTKVKRNGLIIHKLWTYQPNQSNPPFLERLAEYGIFSLHSFFKGLYKKNFDAIITSQPPEFTLFAGYFLKKILDVPWILDVRDLWLENAASLGFLNKNSLPYKSFEKSRKKALKDVDIFAYTAETIREEFTDKYDFNCKFLFNPNGVDPAEYPFKKERKNQLIYIGNIGLAYDVSNLVKAMEYVDKDLKLIIRGGGDDKPRVKKLVKEKNLESKVEFIEKLSRSDLLELISNSKIGLCPLKNKKSLKSVIPTKVIEYMGCGVPFIGTGKGEIRKLAEESNAGIITDNDPKKIADSINTMIEDSENLKELNENGRKYVKKKFNKPKIINRLYNEIMNVI